MVKLKDDLLTLLDCTKGEEKNTILDSNTKDTASEPCSPQGMILKEIEY